VVKRRVGAAATPSERQRGPDAAAVHAGCEQEALDSASRVFPRDDMVLELARLRLFTIERVDVGDHVHGTFGPGDELGRNLDPARRPRELLVPVYGEA